MTRGKPLSFDRDEVLEKALNLFWENGYSQTGKPGCDLTGARPASQIGI